MEKMTYDLIEETIYSEKLPNGLQVYLLPKEEVAKTYGIFMTNYGSIDRTFIPINGNEETTVPDGVAHFLEHKLFEKEDRDVFTDFLSQGASPNAYTSFTKTAYLFSTTKMAEKNVETLLDFVQSPFFSDESVEKEKGIIAQEIKMYDDQPDWQSFMGTIRNMYEHHPVHIDIAGTVSSIQTITKEDLYTCYHTFYHPANMVLFVTGNFDAQSMVRTIELNQAKKSFPSSTEVKRKATEEPETVVVKENVIHLPVSIPKVTIGIKELTKQPHNEAFLKAEMLQGLLLDYFYSPSGTFYEQLYEEQLIDDSFEYSTTVEESFNFSLISSNTREPEQFATRVKEQLVSTKTMKLSEDALQTMKKRRIGQILRSMNSLESIANQFIHYYFMGIDYFTLISAFEALTLTEVNDFLVQWIDEKRLTVCKIDKE
ncbi:EF-P 5-aminopentanol modification-associated protein YfmH [Pseudogracilibacillus auburnensis]|uniref:Putative Zn-dependent peptidase n=1 Tax=Pseudogracilibacillus auburnensis TaxID=1494959 RepID=A0A2V3W6L6_9BACI|nr:pitrilysin family protein [Pseudogracilibacillus auburnensis]PXW88671.1 putative Zn-dependent peptidase [Pseudogracilibacillus auburnensis]